MTLRELLQKALEFEKDLDREVELLIITRNECGSLQTVKYVPIQRYSQDHASIVVEREDLDRAGE